MILYEVRKGKSGDCYAAKVVVFCSLQTLAAFSSPSRAMLHIKNKNMIEQIQGEGRIFVHWSAVFL